MNKELIVNISDDLFYETSELLDDLGLDFSSAVRMFLKRLVKEGDLSFLILKSQINTEKYDRDSNLDIQQSNSNVGYSQITERSRKYEPSMEQRYQPRSVSSVMTKMTKNEAKILFNNKGLIKTKNITFASKNKTLANYWANPSDHLLENDWHIILNDWPRRKMYLFFIPANTIQYSELIPRPDIPHQADIQIAYGDINFTDNKSGFSFIQFLTGEIDY